VTGTAYEARIGEWVLDTALAQAQRWREGGLEISVAVNIGAAHVQESGFAERLRSALARYPGVVARQLEIEILENAAVGDMNRAARSLIEARALGVKVALDDFGTGYSSLAHIRRLPVDLLKIDQSFVRDILDDAKDLEMVETIVQLAQVFRYPVVAEGVETFEHALLLRLLGCRVGQGYGIARPMPAPEFPAWVGRWNAGEIWPAMDGAVFTRADIPLLTAARAHRQWVDRVNKTVGDGWEIPEGSSLCDACGLSGWLSKRGERLHDSLFELHSLSVIHERLHDIADEAIAMSRAGLPEVARERLPALLALRDQLVLRHGALVQRMAARGRGPSADPAPEDDRIGG